MRTDDRSVRRAGSINRVDIRGTRHNSERAGAADANPSVPAYLQRAHANHAGSQTALDTGANRDGTRATVQRARSRFQYSELKKAVISARVGGRSLAASDVAGHRSRRDRTSSRPPLRRGDNTRA